MRRLFAGLLLLVGCENGVGPSLPDPFAPDPVVDRIEILSAPQRGSTYLVDEELVFGVTLARGGELEAAGSAWLEFDLGLSRQVAELRPIEGERLEFAYRLRRGDHDADGVSVPGGEIALSDGGSITLDSQPIDLSLPAIPPNPDHRVFARFAPGENVLLDATFESPEVTLELEGAPGCEDLDTIEPIVEAALRGEPDRAETLFFQGVQFGRCALLDAGREAIFLDAEIGGDAGLSWDLVLVYAEGGGASPSNWWTLGDFLNELE